MGEASGSPQVNVKFNSRLVIYIILVKSNINHKVVITPMTYFTVRSIVSIPASLALQS
jgi:hypothetical protein